MFQVLLSYQMNLELNLILPQMHNRNVRNKTCAVSFLFIVAAIEYSVGQKNEQFISCGRQT